MSATLNTRSDFSIGESLLKTSDIVKLAKSHNYDAVALTDTMSISGLPSFMQAAKKENVKGIIGARLRIYNDLSKDKNRPYFIRCICYTEKALQDLMKLLTFSFSEDRFFRVPRLLLEDVITAFSERTDEVLITSGDAYSLITQDDLDAKIKRLTDAKLNVALELVAASTQYFLRQNSIVMQKSKQLNLPWCVVCSRFLQRERRCRRIGRYEVYCTSRREDG